MQCMAFMLLTSYITIQTGNSGCVVTSITYPLITTTKPSVQMQIKTYKVTPGMHTSSVIT